MKVKLLDWVDDIPPGSVLEVINETDTEYIGIWSSPWGSYEVKVNKKYCKII